MKSEDLLSPAHVATVGRVRSVCTAAGVSGAATSMAANMLASDGTIVGLAVGVIAPGAFILASEIASSASSLPRTKGARPLLATLVSLLLVIGTAAAVVSFGHIREVVAGVGESPVAEVLIAIVVDAVAVMGLVGHRLTGLYLHRHHAATEAQRKADQRVAAEAAAEARRLAVAEAERAQRRAERATVKAGRTTKNGRSAVGRLGPVAGDDPSLPAPERARAIAGANPSMTQAEIAQAVGRGERTVRRYLADTGDGETAPTGKTAGSDAPDQTETETVNDGRQTPGLVAV